MVFCMEAHLVSRDRRGVLHLAVVLEKGQIVDRGLDPENEAELVVQQMGPAPWCCLIRVPFDADIGLICPISPSNAAGQSLRPRNVAMLSGFMVRRTPRFS